MYNGLEHNRGHGKAFMNLRHCYFLRIFRDILQILVYSYILYFQVLDCRCQMGMVMKADNSSCIVRFFLLCQIFLFALYAIFLVIQYL